MKDISIIVPVYNAYDYLEACIESLLNQTMDTIQIIMVNDASSDNSYMIMQQYEKKFPDKIRCIYLEKNLSQGGARNVGLSCAEGKYVMYVDSDDTIHPTMCEKLYKKALDTDSDIVFCDLYKIYTETGKKLWFSYVAEELMGSATEEKRKRLMLSDGYPVCRLIKRELLQENDIMYPCYIKYEDFATMPVLMAYYKKCSYVQEALYNYYLRDGSTSQNSNSTRHYDYIKASQALMEEMKRRQLYLRYKAEIDALCIYSYLFCMQKIFRFTENPDLQKLYHLAAQMRKDFPYYKDNPYYHIKNEPTGNTIAEYCERGYTEFVNAFRNGRLQEDQSYYYNYYNMHKQRIEKLLKKIKQNEQTVAVWGGGKKGRDFLAVFDKNQQYINCVIDNNPDKWGQSLETGHIMASFDTVKKSVDCILVMNRNYYSGILKEIRSNNAEITAINIDIYMFLTDIKNAIYF